MSKIYIFLPINYVGDYSVCIDVTDLIDGELYKYYIDPITKSNNNTTVTAIIRSVYNSVKGDICLHPMIMPINDVLANAYYHDYKDPHRMCRGKDDYLPDIDVFNDIRIIRLLDILFTLHPKEMARRILKEMYPDFEAYIIMRKEIFGDNDTFSDDVMQFMENIDQHYKNNNIFR